MQCEKENQLRKIQEIKERELGEWKKRRQCEIQDECGNCLTSFGAAHIAACEASCEEDEMLHQKREEYDLMAAQRGRSAMLQEQRKRDREAEERLMKRKRRQQRNAGVQADLMQRPAPRNINRVEEESAEEISDEEENSAVRVQTFVNKPNLHKSSNYNPKNFTSNSVDSSNSTESSLDVESEEEFNQITNLLKQKCFETYHEPPAEVHEHPIEILSSSEDEPEALPIQKTKAKPQLEPKKKSILKKVQSPKGKKLKTKPPMPVRKVHPEDQRVNYVDFGNKYVTSYVANDDLVTQNNPTTRRNATSEATKHEQSTNRSVSDDVLK